MRWFAAAGASAVLGFLGSGLANAANPPSPLRLGVVHSSGSAHDLDLAELVPRGGTLDHVWGRDREGVRWVPHTLIGDSPYPIADWSGRAAVRLADVTGDGHDDLLLSVGIAGSNHGSTVISVFATFGRDVRRIYGRPYYAGGKDGRPRPGEPHQRDDVGHPRGPPVVRRAARRQLRLLPGVPAALRPPLDWPWLAAPSCAARAPALLTAWFAE